jgi:predicted acetyltransferase
MNYTVTKEELVKNSNQPQQTIENYKKEYDEIEEIQNDFKDKNQSLNYSNELNDFIEHEGKIINKSDVVISVWEDYWSRDEGMNFEMDMDDFESEDFSSLLRTVEHYYDTEIQSQGGSVEIYIKEFILHISNDSDDVWEEI